MPSEAPIKPTPAISEPVGDACHGAARAQHRGERFGEARVLLGRADGHAQVALEAVDVHRAHDDPAPEQRFVDVRAVADVDQAESSPSSARRVGPSRSQTPAQKGEAFAIVGARALDVLVIVERGERRHLRERVDVEGLPDAVQHLDDRERADAVPDAQAGEAVDLREGPQREQQAAASL